jgi:hypothetical protein
LIWLCPTARSLVGKEKGRRDWGLFSCCEFSSAWRMGRRGIACCGIHTHHGGKSSAYLIAKSYFAHISCDLAHHQEHNKSRIQSCYFSSSSYTDECSNITLTVCAYYAHTCKLPNYLCLMYNGQAYIKQYHTPSLLPQKSSQRIFCMWRNGLCAVAFVLVFCSLTFASMKTLFSFHRLLLLPQSNHLQSIIQS